MSSPPIEATTRARSLPAAARQHTNAGAEAFVHYYNDQLSKAWMTPQAGLLAPLSLPSCKSCRTWEQTAASLVANKEHSDRPVIVVKEVVYDSIEDAALVVLASGTQSGASLLNSRGEVVSTGTPKPVTFAYYVIWTSGEWKVQEVKIG
ncbi:MAG: DUF6318 family protein [Nostocoides sp.]